MKRIAPYAFALLVAALLSIVPAAIYADLATPLTDWDNWYWKGQPHARPHFTLANLPPALRTELALFKVLSAPPSWVRKRLTGYPTVYGAQFGSGIIYETAGVPPLAFAWSHITWAVPVWFVTIAFLYEVSHVVRSRLLRVHAS